jgi:hypothetical protein
MKQPQAVPRQQAVTTMLHPKVVLDTPKAAQINGHRCSQSPLHPVQFLWLRGGLRNSAAVPTHTSRAMAVAAAEPICTRRYIILLMCKNNCTDADCRCCHVLSFRRRTTSPKTTHLLDALMRCVMLSCAVCWCYAVLCCCVVVCWCACCVVLCCAVVWRAVLCCVVSFRVASCRVVLCCVMLFFGVLCCA